MEIQRISSVLERRIVIGMIVSDEFLNSAHILYKPELFHVPILQRAADWCIEFLNQYGTAPKSHFFDIYAAKRRTDNIPEDSAREMEIVLSNLSSEYLEHPELNVKYLLRQTEKLMRSRSLLQLSETIRDLAVGEEVDEAESALLGYAPITQEGVTWSDPFRLSDTQLEMMEADTDTLFTFPGAAGELIGPIERDSFIAIQAPEKRGKTFWLWEFALRGNLHRLNVAFFSVGDMSDIQNWRRVFGWTLRTSRRYSNKEIVRPVLDCLLGQKGECRDCDEEPVIDNKGILLPLDAALDHRPCTRCAGKRGLGFVGSRWYERVTLPDFSPWAAKKKMSGFIRRSGGKSIRLKCYPARSANTKTIRTTLNLWERRDGWVPDMIVIDYADILAPEDYRESDTRHQINATWAALRGLSTERSIAVVTATQAAKTSYNKSNQDMSDVSEDKRKLGHVTSMIGLNQTPEEKRAQVCRLTQLVAREEDFDIYKNVVCLQCLKMSRPLLASYWL